MKIDMHAIEHSKFIHVQQYQKVVVNMLKISFVYIIVLNEIYLYYVQKIQVVIKNTIRHIKCMYLQTCPHDSLIQ